MCDLSYVVFKHMFNDFFFTRKKKLGALCMRFCVATLAVFYSGEGRKRGANTCSQ